MANGIPSRRRQISATAFASSASATEKRDETLCARSTNKLAAAELMPPPMSSDGTDHSCSSATSSRSRLVAKIRAVAGTGEDGLDQVGRGVAHVLAVVEHQQPDPAFQRGGHALGHGLARLLGNAQHRGHRIGHRRRIGDRRQFEKPNTVREFIGQIGRDLQRPAWSCRPHLPRSRSPADEP